MVLILREATPVAQSWIVPLRDYLTYLLRSLSLLSPSVRYSRFRSARFKGVVSIRSLSLGFNNIL